MRLSLLPVLALVAGASLFTAARAPAASTVTAAEHESHWYFESLSADGKRALLRELDPGSRAKFHMRVVDVATGKAIEETSLPELARVPATTLGGKATEISQLEWMLASPAFARDIAQGARIAQSFPFGACGRLAAGKAIAFDAGDWLYVADEQGRVQRRIADEAAYDPRFSPDGKHLFYRKATGSDGLFATYELFVVPSDLSAPARAIPGTAGLRDRFQANPDGLTAVGISSISSLRLEGNGAPPPVPRASISSVRLEGNGAPPPVPRGWTSKAKASETCVVSFGLKPPFAARRLACLEGGEQLVESVISPRGKWAAISTKRHAEDAGRRVFWRLRVVSLATGKVVRDEPEPAGMGIRAISDSGVLVQSESLPTAASTTIVTDVVAKKWRALDQSIDLGHRGYFRNDKDLVYVRGGSVAVVDVSKD